jgi:hypothetical protein
MTVYKKMFSAVALALVASGWLVEAGFVVDNFDGYTLPKTVNQLGNGWGAGDDTAVVTNLLSASTPNSVFVPQWTTVSNAVSQSGTTYPHVWTEFAIYDSGRLIPGAEPGPSGNEGVMLGVSTGGYATVYDPGVTNWVTYTNDVWGTNMVVGAGAWAQFSVFQNFSNCTAAVFLNGHLMRAGLPFISNSLTNYGTFRLDGGNLTNGFLDNVVISNAIPSSLAGMDLDNDGVADSVEIDTYGNVATIRRLTNTVSVTGSGSITPAGTFTVPWNTNVTYALTGAEAYVVGAVTNNGAATVFGTKTATYTDSNITTDRAITASFVYNGIRYVPGDHTAIADALAVAQAGDRIVVSNGTYAGSIALSNGVTLVGTNLSGNATNLTVQGAMTVGTGTISVASGSFTVTGQVTVAAGGLLIVSNTAVNFNWLTIGAGGAVSVIAGSMTINGMTTNGTFTLDETWSSAMMPSTLNFTDGFEVYPSGTPLRSLGFYGWAATDAGAVVTNGAAVVAQDVKAAFIPAGAMVSHTVSAAGITNVWTDLYVKDAAQVTPETQPLVNSNSAVMVFFGTNGYLTVYNSNTWDVCSNNVMMRAVARVNAGQWARVSIFQNFSNRTAAIFLNDQLLREQVPFISAAVSQYGSLSMACGVDGSACLDAVKIWTNVPGLVGDLNNDQTADAREIELFGNLNRTRGAIFRFR